MTDPAQHAKRRLEELVSFFGINLEAAVDTTTEGIELDVPASAATPRLIGHHGETLRALEFIVSQMVKHADPDAPRVLLDIAGYRKARRDQLQQLARDVATRVTQSGQEEELQPMNPAERRIVHMALRDLPGITTESRGQDRKRRIVVLPAADASSVV